MNNNLTPDTPIKALGKIMTFGRFASIYTDNDLESAVNMFELLVKKGNANIIDTRSKDEKFMEKLLAEEAVVAMGNAVEEFEHERKVNSQKFKNEGRLTYPEIQIQYPDFLSASQAEQFYQKELLLEDTEVTKKGGICYLIVRDITDNQLNFINATYKRDRVVAGAMNLTEKGVDNIVGAVDYTAKNVLSPAFKIGAKGAIGLIKSLTGVVARTGATVVTSTTKGAKETIEYLRDDEEVIKAGKDLINTKDSISRSLNDKFGSSSINAGINIVK